MRSRCALTGSDQRVPAVVSSRKLAHHACILCNKLIVCLHHVQPTFRKHSPQMRRISVNHRAGNYVIELCRARVTCAALAFYLRCGGRKACAALFTRSWWWSCDVRSIHVAVGFVLGLRIVRASCGYITGGDARS